MDVPEGKRKYETMETNIEPSDVEEYVIELNPSEEEFVSSKRGELLDFIENLKPSNILLEEDLNVVSDESKISSDESKISSDESRISLDESKISSDESKTDIISNEIAENKNTMISIITSHGGIPCTIDNANYDTFVIPEGIEVIKFTISVPGIVSYADQVNVDNYIKLINKYADDLINTEVNDAFLKIIVEGIQELFKDIVKKKLNKYKKNKYISDLLHHYEKGFNIYKLRAGDRMINKIYTRDVAKKKLNNWSIIELSHKYSDEDVEKSLPDIFFKIPRNITPINIRFKIGLYMDIIRTEQLIEYYKSKGIKKLLIFDFSCSDFTNTSNNLKLFNNEDRLSRRLRRNTKQENIPSGGLKKKRKTRKRRKSRKNRRK